jgi:hypothetical protein
MARQIILALMHGGRVVLSSQLARRGDGGKYLIGKNNDR